MRFPTIDSIDFEGDMIVNPDLTLKEQDAGINLG